MSRTPDDIHDELLVLKCQESDRDALRSLIQRWHPRLSRLAWRLSGQREQTQDIVQDAWLAIVRTIGRLDDPARFRTWAYRIVANKCADGLRRRVVQRRGVDEIRHAAKAKRSDGLRADRIGDETDALRNALSKLTDEQRAILSLHYLDELQLSDIARLLNLPVGTVKSRLHSARSRMREVLERKRP